MKIYVKKHVRRDDVLATLAHDLRTPMCCVQGAAQLALLAQRQGEDVSAQMEQILLAVGAMDKLLSQLCDAQGAGQAVPFTGDRLARELTALIARQAEAKGQRLSMDLGAMGTKPVVADYMALTRVLTNLLTNAIKYTPEGGSIALCASRTADGLRFDVSDTGMGMKPEFMERMFAPFERAKESAHQSGRGLGLSIAKRLTRQMGGVIAAQSEWGRGTTFTVEIPLRAAQGMEAPDARLPLVPHT